MTRTIEYTASFKPAKYSEVVEEVFYDESRKELYVKLHTGVVAGYSNVPAWAYAGFKSAPSAGKHWNWNIKNNYGTMNGDVNFIPYDRGVSESKQSTGNKNFSVVVNVNGDLRFDLDAEDVVAATKRVYELIEKSVVDGVYFVKEVKINNQGN